MRIATLVDVDGTLCAREEQLSSYKPEINVYYFPLGETASAPELVGQSVYIGRDGVGIKQTYGYHDIPFKRSADGKVYFPKVETIPVPCPKVRAGIETRWDSAGYWMKLLKKGWVPA